MKPRIFIGSSIEGLPIAHAIQENLDRIAEVTVWTNNVFDLSSYRYDAIEKQLNNTHYGIFVLTADDVVESRERKTFAPRDNVIFELGMFAGRLGLQRIFIVYPRNVDIKIPSDLLGITPAKYEPHSSGNITASVSAICNQIKSQIEIGTRNGVRINWEEVHAWVMELSSTLKRGPSRGGFIFDVIVGISGGGLVVADLLSRCYGRQHPVISLWADRHGQYPVSNFEPPMNWVNKYMLPIFSEKNVTNILIVDSITRTGTTVVQAKKFLANSFPNKQIKNAVLIADESLNVDIDYCIRKLPTKNLVLPFSDYDS
jgi:Predicted nucleotide-binding protein containing TIR -like domain